MNNDRLYRLVCRVGAIISACFVFIFLTLVQTSYPFRDYPTNVAEAAEEAWKLEFNDVCSKTNDSMSLSREELKSLITRCEKLKPVIEGQEESTRKVYGKRLEMCKNLLVFVLESKK